MLVLDVSVVTVALPTMGRDLGIGDQALQWIINAYVLVFAGLLLLGGRLADLFGRRRIFLSGLVLFTAASLFGGLATAGWALIAARAGQGFGAAVLAPTTLTMITTTFPEGSGRTRAIAAWTAMGFAGGAAGGVLSGVLTEYLTWRSTLLINVPIGVVAIALVVRQLEGDELTVRRSLDVPGAVLATGGLTALTYAVSQGGAYGWTAPSFYWGLIAAVVLLALFVLVEHRYAATPLIPLRLLRIPAIARGNVASVLAGACMVPMWYFLTLTVQHTLHYSPLQAGLALLPHALVSIVVGVRVTPWLMSRVDGRTLVVFGASLAAAGFWWQSLLTPDMGYVLGILGPALLISSGGGLLNTPITTIAASGAGPAEAGAVSGLLTTARQSGAAIGLAVLVSISGTHLDRAWLATAITLLFLAVFAFFLPAQRDSARVS
ncbi:MFS transporter [Pseudonocardiaceae bacterium YIM PH 21723]|nr:MFS transporter [Pseudonocardiaceae bacterium YIM PH 21723]